LSDFEELKRGARWVATRHARIYAAPMLLQRRRLNWDFVEVGHLIEQAKWRKRKRRRNQGPEGGKTSSAQTAGFKN
jgi:hypothetical protein